MFRKTTFIACAIATTCLAVPFENMRLDQEFNTTGLDAVNSSLARTNDTTIIGRTQERTVNSETVNGVTFDIKEDGEVRFIFSEEVLGQPTGNPIDRITINGVSLLSIIDQRIQDRFQALGGVSRSDVTNTVREMVYNPLWGKKLAVIGDSLTCTPTKETSYPYYIAQRNNMTLVHNGRSGERLCENATNSLGVITNPSTISSYTNDIPADVDFILCQIGANDVNNWWKRDAELETPVPDTDMTIDTFKGCWNNLLIGLKKNYPNAKIGMILANNWQENLGKKSEDTLWDETATNRRGMTQWQKKQCQKLNIHVIDPVEDTRMFVYHYNHYVTNVQVEASSLDLNWYDRTKLEIGTDHSWYKTTVPGWVFQTQYMKDTQHLTAEGNLFVSFFYENWMKTALMCD